MALKPHTPNPSNYDIDKTLRAHVQSDSRIGLLKARTATIQVSSNSDPYAEAKISTIAFVGLDVPSRP
jgi:hypothetical protein